MDEKLKKNVSVSLTIVYLYVINGVFGTICSVFTLPSIQYICPNKRNPEQKEWLLCVRSRMDHNNIEIETACGIVRD